MPGADAYATSKQCSLATAQEFARETPRLRINAVEPGFNPGTGLGREANSLVRFLVKYVATLLVPVMRFASTPKRAARVITRVLLNECGDTGVYYDNEGRPMGASTRVRDPEFTARVVAETRALLAAVPG